MFLTKQQHLLDFEKFVDYYKWFDNSISLTFCLNCSCPCWRSKNCCSCSLVDCLSNFNKPSCNFLLSAAAFFAVETYTSSNNFCCWTNPLPKVLLPTIQPLSLSWTAPAMISLAEAVCSFTKTTKSPSWKLGYFLNIHYIHHAWNLACAKSNQLFLNY